MDPVRNSHTLLLSHHLSASHSRSGKLFCFAVSGPARLCTNRRYNRVGKFQRLGMNTDKSIVRSRRVQYLTSSGTIQPGAVRVSKDCHYAFKQSRLYFTSLWILLPSRPTAIASTSPRSTPSSLPVGNSWRTLKKAKRAKASPRRYKTVPGSTFDFCLLGR